MNRLTGMLISAIVIFFFSACGSSSSSTSDIIKTEVNGPGGAFAGAAEFSSAMVAGQVIYTFDEKDNLWIGIDFQTDGQVGYEITDGKEFGDTYSIEDGKIVIKDSDNNEKYIIALDLAKATVWEVTGTDDDGKVWQDTWHLELKLRSDMLVGKRYLSEYIWHDIVYKEELLFTETTLKVYNIDGTLLEEVPYKLENGALESTNAEGVYHLFLMFIEPDGKLYIWWLTESESNHSTWTPLNN